MASGESGTCSNGHESDWDDYCSVCGVSMAPSGAAAETATEVPENEAEGEAPTLDPAATSCPNCNEATGAADIFCENCGYEFLSGTLPDSGPTPLATAPDASEVAWNAVVSVDLDFFERMQFAGVEPPAISPEPTTIELPPTDVLVGRHSESRGTFPEVDLGSMFAEEGATDPAVSTNHCRLHRGSGGWTITDLGSTNGTFLADETESIAPGTPMSLMPGTPIFVGAWTRIELVEAS